MIALLLFNTLHLKVVSSIASKVPGSTLLRKMILYLPVGVTVFKIANMLKTVTLSYMCKVAFTIAILSHFPCGSAMSMHKKQLY